MKIIHIVIIVIVGLAIAYVVSLYGATTQYVSFPQADKLAKEYPGKNYHVVTRLNKLKGIEYDARTNPNFFAFYALDSLGNERRVEYHSSKPENFEHAEKVVIEGRAEGDHFVAHKIYSKCPSKYQQEIKKEQPAANGTY